jgi:protein gp37
MGKESKIEWTDATFNPWWGCEKVSDGCKNCYAEGWSKRTGHGIWGKNAPRRFFGDKHWNEPLLWNRAAEEAGTRSRVFCASMADVFEDRADLIPHQDRLFKLIRATPNLNWLLLTKRPQNIERLSSNWLFPHNVWLGTSAENQKYWDERVPILMSMPAMVHFVSVEPMLGPIDMGSQTPEWVIVGGESGPGARPIEREWVESMQTQCADRLTKFFFKQWGGVRKQTTGRELHGTTFSELPNAA